MLLSYCGLWFPPCNDAGASLLYAGGLRIVAHHRRNRQVMHFGGLAGDSGGCILGEAGASTREFEVILTVPLLMFRPINAVSIVASIDECGCFISKLKHERFCGLC